MNPLVPYIFFNGNCRDAMNFYKSCFGGDLQAFTYGDAPPDSGMKDAPKDAIMHSTLIKDSLTIMASDWPGGAANQGNNISLSIDCGSMSEIETLFKALSQGGKVTQPLADTFWDAHFGMLTDQFGIHWMLNCPLKK